MTLRINELIEVDLISTGRYASATSNNYLTFADATTYAAQIRLGDTLNVGKIDWTLDHAIEDPDGDVLPNWKNLITGQVLSCSSQTAIQFDSSSASALLPYGRLQVIAKSGAAADFTVANIVAHIMAEFK
jgi:hypothetical protein